MSYLKCLWSSHQFSQKVARRRGCICQLKEKFKAENCEGVEGCLHTDWCSEDRSDPGDADPASWKARRLAKDKYALESRGLMWRGTWVRLLVFSIYNIILTLI